MRNTFIDELIKLATVNNRIALIVGDLGFSVVEPFAEKFPDRFINAGVAEQNMMGLAAGMASEGYHVFVYSIANFPTFRCAEQIRNDVAYHRLAVTVVAVGGGLAYGNLGYSHHAVQDYGLMRLMPNMLIAAPGDPMEVRACMRYLTSHPQPSYLRLGKTGEPNFHTSVPELVPGKWLPIHQPGDRPDSQPNDAMSRASQAKHKTLLTTGAPLAYACQWVKQDGIFRDYAVHSLPLWSMGTKREQVDQIAQFSEIVTVEDHLRDAGFGSWMLEAMSESPDLLGRIRIKALSAEVCGMVGKQEVLNELGGLTA